MRGQSDVNIGVRADGQSTVIVNGNVTGKRVEVQPAGLRSIPLADKRCHVGVLTVLTQELHAVVDRLRQYPYEKLPLADGATAHRAAVPGSDGGELRVIAVQTLDQGSLSASAAYHRLREWFDPQIVLLVGTAAAIRDDVAVGDVVIGDQVIYYDARRETPNGARRRGESQPMTPFIKHRLNRFFDEAGGTTPMRIDDIHVFRGPIGSGDAVITDADSDIITWLRTNNEKVLAVETEAGAVGRTFYEDVDAGRRLGWLTIRGITDRADQPWWGEDRRRLASQRAAHVMDRLLPFLTPPAHR